MNDLRIFFVVRGIGAAIKFFCVWVLYCTKNSLRLLLLFLKIQLRLIFFFFLPCNSPLEDCNTLAFLNNLDCKDHCQLSIGMQVAVGHLLCTANFKRRLYYVLHLHLCHTSFFFSARALSLHLRNFLC